MSRQTGGDGAPSVEGNKNNGAAGDDAVIACRNLWKIFGDDADSAMQAIIDDGLDKERVKERFNCVVGVQDVSFSVPEGEIFCIMGLSGSGKSTLIRHFNRLIEPTAGDIWVNGTHINGLDGRALRNMRASMIGMVFQSMALMPHRTVRDNVSFPLEVRGDTKNERHETSEALLDLVELGGWGDSYPDELSGGMQQRVGLARAMAPNPSILLMDEPFSALDPLIRRQLQDQFMLLSQTVRKTTLFITHDLDEAFRIGQRIGIMKDGRLVQIGTPEEIVVNPADDYVADFVAGLSNLHLVTASCVMEPLAVYERRDGALDIAACPTGQPEDDLDTLTDLSIDTLHPVVIQDDGKTVGVVTKKALLRGLQGRWNETTA